MAQNDFDEIISAGPFGDGDVDWHACLLDLNFDGSSLQDTCQDHELPSLPFEPNYDFSDIISVNFEDGFSSFNPIHFETFEQINDEHKESNNENPDNKMLGFGKPISMSPVFDKGVRICPKMSAELNGMFFVAENVFGVEATEQPIELTCYRRNLFQISGNLTLSRSMSHMTNEQLHLPLQKMSVKLSAFETIEGKETEIMSLPWKTPIASATEDKSGTPPEWPLDLSTRPEQGPFQVSIPIAWKRLQFKHATANNGRRKGLQQYYVVRIALVARLDNGNVVNLAEIQSNRIIVRGRSPGNYESKKSAVDERKIELDLKMATDDKSAPKSTRVGVAYKYGLYAQNSPNTLCQPTLVNSNLARRSSMSSETLRKSTTQNASSNITLIQPSFSRSRWNSDSIISNTAQHVPPIDLLLDDDDPPCTKVRSIKPTTIAKLQHDQATVSSTMESTDLLYEYFPLSLDDWMTPVDAIYRPHVVHHTIVPPDMKAEQFKRKTKRYFSGDD